MLQIRLWPAALIVGAMLGGCGTNNPSMMDGSSDAQDAVANHDATDSSNDASNEPTVLLPIEVLGEPGTIERTSIRMRAAPSQASYLWLHTHRLTWREDGEFATTTSARNNVRPGSKGSVRLNGGPWVPLTNATVTCEPHEAAFGCLNGSLMAVRVRVATERLGMPGLQAGDNTLEFRFDATDGISSGWRVLGIDVRDAANASLLSTRFVMDDPNTWQPPLTGADDVTAGRMLWQSAPLTDLGFANTRHPIRARCGSCHFEDGYDLAYFNYSNRSIVVRSMFHGLSERQGQQIASYIRSLPLQLPMGVTRRDAGRPWNPPYQPGPGLDARPVELWAAGAGLSAVLERDADMRAHLFPDGQYRASLVGTDGFLNPRETPLSLQFPDWNAWVPTIGVEDLVDDPSQLAMSVPMQRLRTIRDFLTQHRWTDMESDAQVRGQAFFMFRQFMDARGTSFPTERYYTHRDVPMPQRTRALMLAQTRHNLARYSFFTLRMFEILHRFSLEDWTDRSHAVGSPAVPRGYRSWGQTGRVVFEAAPHFVADQPGLDFNYTQPGNYLSTAWYSMEQVINGGYRAATFGIDWNYHPGHISNVQRSAMGFYTDGPAHAYHWAWSLFWMYQGVPQTTFYQDPPQPFSPSSFGFYQRQFGLGLDMVPGADLLEMRGEITREDRARLQEALALAFLGVAERYRPDQWVRRVADDDAHRTSDNFETVNYVARDVPDLRPDAAEWGYQADAYYRRIRLLRDNNLVTPATLTRLVNWAAGVWPRGEWDRLRPSM